MKRISLTEVGIEAAAAEAAAALRAGGVVLYPTDTLYGLGADARSDDAVAKVYEIKGRREDKPMHAIVSDMKMAQRYGDVSPYVRSLAETLPKGKVSFVVPKQTGLDTGIARAIDTFGFRIPDHDFCAALTRAFDGPITATSANMSGATDSRDVEAILAQLGERADLIDLVVDAGVLPPSAPSTVVDCTGDTPIVLREGAVLTTRVQESARV